MPCGWRAGWHYEHSSQPGQKLGPRALQGLQRLPAAHLNLLFERVQSAHMQRQFEPSDTAPPTGEQLDAATANGGAGAGGAVQQPRRPQGRVHVVDKSHDVCGLERHPIVKLWFRKNFSFQSAELEEAYERQRALFFREAHARDFQVESSEHMLLQLSETDTGGAQEGAANDENLMGSRLQLIPEGSESPPREPFSRLIDSVILVVPDGGKPLWARNVTYWAASLLLLGWPLRFYCELRTAYLCFHVHKSFARLEDAAAAESFDGCSALPRASSVPLDSNDDEDEDDADDLIFQNGSVPLARDPTMCTLDLDLHLAHSTKRAPSYSQAAAGRKHSQSNGISRSERPASLRSLDGSKARVPSVRSVLPASATLVDLLPRGCCDQCGANGVHWPPPLRSNEAKEDASGRARVPRSRTLALLQSAARLGDRLRLPTSGLSREQCARDSAPDTEERLLARQPNAPPLSTAAAASSSAGARVSHSVSMPVDLSARAACSRL